jgi:hypothetical protein
MRIPLVAWIFQGIPECLGMTALLLSLDTKPLNWRIIGAIGFLQAVIAFVVRMLPFTPGVHVFILPISMALLAARIGRVNPDKALIITVIITIFIASWEMVMYSSLHYLKIITFKETITSSYLRIILGLPQVVLLFLSALFLQKRKNRRKLWGDRGLAAEEK